MCKVLKGARNRARNGKCRCTVLLPKHVQKLPIVKSLAGGNTSVGVQHTEILNIGIHDIAVALVSRIRLNAVDGLLAPIIEAPVQKSRNALRIACPLDHAAVGVRQIDKLIQPPVLLGEAAAVAPDGVPCLLPFAIEIGIGGVHLKSWHVLITLACQLQRDLVRIQRLAARNAGANLPCNLSCPIPIFGGVGLILQSQIEHGKPALFFEMLVNTAPVGACPMLRLRLSDLVPNDITVIPAAENGLPPYRADRSRNRQISEATLT